MSCPPTLPADLCADATDAPCEPVRFFLAPHKGQTVTLRVTDELIAALEDADGVERMNAHYLELYNRGAFGNKELLKQLYVLRAQGVREIEGKIGEHVDADERIATGGQRVMVVSSEYNDIVSWCGPWEGERERGTTLSATDLILPEVQLEAQLETQLGTR